MPHDADRLAHMLDAARRAVELGAGREREDLDSDELLALALTRLLEILGEAAKGVSAETRSQFPQLPWHQMAATRDRLIDAYFSIDLDIVWRVVRVDLPPVLPALQSAAERYATVDHPPADPNE